jgi:hexosaminidase
MKSAGQHIAARLGALTLALGLAQGVFAVNLSQQQLNEFAGKAQLRFGVVSNLAAKPEQPCLRGRVSGGFIFIPCANWTRR